MYLGYLKESIAPFKVTGHYYRVLPMNERSETGQRVIIKHKEDYSLQVQSSGAATKWHKMVGRPNLKC